MKIKMSILLVIFFLTAFPVISHCAEIRLSAAASTSDVIKELAAVYIKENPGVAIFTNFGSSGSLAKQILQGAPADLFLSANIKWMDYLVKENKIEGKTIRVFAANSLVFVGPPKAGVASLEAVPSLARIAIGSPQSVPAGQYAEQAMRTAGIYGNLQSGNKLVMAKDVRQALLYAERGEVDGAFVYKTDALLAQQTVILFTVPTNLHDPIDYPVGLTLEGSKNQAAKLFLAFLASPKALAVLQNFGFSAPSSLGGGSN